MKRAQPIPVAANLDLRYDNEARKLWLHTRRYFSLDRWVPLLVT